MRSSPFPPAYFLIFAILLSAISSCQPAPSGPVLSEVDLPAGRIAFIDSNMEGHPELAVISGDGSDQHNLFGPLTLGDHPRFLHPPRWSPDGNEIAITIDVDGNPEIYLVHADGSGFLRLTDNQATDTHPSWSPDGSRIAFVSTRDGNPEIYAMDSDGSDVRRLSESPENDGFAAWSPTGEHIAFETNRDGNFEVYIINPDGTELVNLTNTQENDFLGDWSPDGSKVVLETGCGPDFVCDIAVSPIDGSDMRILASHRSNDLTPVWAGESGFIVFVSERNVSRDLYLVSEDGTELVRLTRNPFDQFMPQWIADPDQ